VSLAGHPQNSNTIQSDEATPGLSEFDLKYYGWRVVLAACFGVMAGSARCSFICSRFP
jgi:hypothetical protein